MGNALGFVSHVQCPFQIRLSCLFLLVCLNLQAFENVKTFFSSWKWKGKSLSCVWFSVTPWTMQSVEFSRSEYWSGQPFPSPGDLPNPGTEPRSPLQEDSLPAGSQGKPKNTGVGSLSLLQGVFPSQELNPGLLHCRWILYQLSHKGSHGQDKNKPKSKFAPRAEVYCSKAKIDCAVPWPDRISLWK